MICSRCDANNDADALFCEQCGSVLGAASGKSRRPYWYAVLLVPVLLLAAGIGYYRFVLPNGVAAEVNGEAITMAELEAAVRTNGNAASLPAEVQGQLRYASLSELITKRIALQEARKTGVRVSADEVQAAVETMRSASGLDNKAFAAKVVGWYGSMAVFRKSLEQTLVIRKFIDQKVTAGASGPADANNRLNQWLQNAAANAAVRVALDEQLPTSGSGCCGNGKSPAKQGCDPSKGAARQGCGPAKGCGPQAGKAAGSQQTSVQGETARVAALAFWKKQNGSRPVETKVTDYGCHVQVDIVENNRIAKSLRYQNGMITEM